MSTDDPLSSLLHNTRELEDFLHDFIGQLAKRKLKPGADVSRLPEKFGLEMPSALKGAKITWDGTGDHGAAERETGEQVLVLSRPGQFDAVGLTIGCIRIRRFQICLECGWFYCRIVIKGRF
ncbi:MAG: hypothetical protein JSS04_08815 [Proteobacteria bacterium]|nr:hypothetical protein [Pseudomonadota bacterium]